MLFYVTLVTCADAIVSVDAEDIEDAIEKAYEKVPADVCRECSGVGSGYNLSLGEWSVAADTDGNPDVSKV